MADWQSQAPEIGRNSKRKIQAMISSLQTAAPPHTMSRTQNMHTLQQGRAPTRRSWMTLPGAVSTRCAVRLCSRASTSGAPSAASPARSHLQAAAGDRAGAVGAGSEGWLFSTQFVECRKKDGDAP